VFKNKILLITGGTGIMSPQKTTKPKAILIPERVK